MMIAAFLLALTLGILLADEGKCAWCPTIRCYGGDCPGDCQCFIPPGQGYGGCFSID
jgi:hypothetical protein